MKRLIHSLFFAACRYFKASEKSSLRLRAFILSLVTTPLVAGAPAEENASWQERLRVRTLHNMDLLLHWSSSRKSSYPLAYPLEDSHFTLYAPALVEFAKQHGYFSVAYPLIGKVSSASQDLELTATLLQTLPSLSIHPDLLSFTIAELLTKILAYRDLHPGLHLELPINQAGVAKMQTFVVDHVFNIWHGMPAFGLVPLDANTSSILLFRGTDFSLITKRGLASVMSDLDPSGPGLHAFLHARKELSSWLQKVHAENKPATVMGFSLGGALAAYTFIYEHPYLSHEPSVSVCAPGLSTSMVKTWYQLPKTMQQAFVSYVNAGDLVSHVGTLFGSTYCLSADQLHRPLQAHTLLMSAESPLHKVRVATAIPPYLPR